MIIASEGTEDEAPFHWERDTCPSCGSGEVLHHIIGMPMAEAYESSPPWVIWEGCVGIGPARECQACGAQWTPDDEWDEDEDDEDNDEGEQPDPPAGR